MLLLIDIDIIGAGSGEGNGRNVCVDRSKAPIVMGEEAAANKWERETAEQEQSSSCTRGGSGESKWKIVIDLFRFRGC